MSDRTGFVYSCPLCEFYIRSNHFIDITREAWPCCPVHEARLNFVLLPHPLVNEDNEDDA